MTMLRAFVYFMLAGSSSAVYDIRGRLVCNHDKRITADVTENDAWVELDYMGRNDPQWYCSSFNVGGYVYDDADVIKVSDARGLECINLCIILKKHREPSITDVTVYHPGPWWKYEHGCLCVKNRKYTSVANMSTCHLQETNDFMKIRRTLHDNRVSLNGKQDHSVSNEDNVIRLEGAAGRMDNALMVMVKVTNYHCPRPHYRRSETPSHRRSDVANAASWILNLKHLIIVDEVGVEYGRSNNGYRLMTIQTRQNDNDPWVTCNSFVYQREGKQYVSCSKLTVALSIKVSRNDTDRSGPKISVYPGDPNVALGRAPPKSEDYKAVDGDYTTAFISTNNHFIIDLEELITIDKVYLHLDKNFYTAKDTYKDMKIWTNQWNLVKWTLCSQVGKGMRFRYGYGSDTVQRQSGKCRPKPRARAVKIENSAVLSLNEVEIREDAMYFYPPTDCFDALTPKFGCEDLTFDLYTGDVFKAAKRVKAGGPSGAPNSHEITESGAWTLVRHVPAGNKWHKATDQLKGHDVYGTPCGATCGQEWSIKFDNIKFYDFLFSTGDGTKWLIATEYNVNGGNFYTYQKRKISTSSMKPRSYEANWRRRENRPEDPWISLSDANDDAINHGNTLYRGDSSDDKEGILQNHNGANVYIRERAFYNITNVMFNGPLYNGYDFHYSKKYWERQRHARVLSDVKRDKDYSKIYTRDIHKWELIKSGARRSRRGNAYYMIRSKQNQGFLYATESDISQWYNGRTDHYAKVEKQFTTKTTDDGLYLWEIVKGDDAHYTIVNKALGKPLFAVMSRDHLAVVADPTDNDIPDGTEKWDIVRV